ncbi:hypothetical protein DVH05_005125 [Phytophthora capsici]|nr:hypothetical protein DVH05_005125 [Phytophthora capsici]
MMLYSTRKPAGVADMPPHVKEAKLLKKVIDDKACVEEMDDGPDADCQEDEEDEQPGFSFEYEGDDDICNTSSSMGSTATTHFATATDNYRPNGFDDVVTTPIGRIDEPLDSTDVREGLEAFDTTPRPSPSPSCPTQRQLRSAGLPKPNPPTTTRPSANHSEKPPAAHARAPEESNKYVNVSNRLSGGNLAEFRTSIGSKSEAEDDDDLAKASYA